MALTVSVDEIVERSRNPLLGIRPHWKRIRLGEVASILNGFAFKSAQFAKNEGMPLIRIRDVGSDTTETKYVGEVDSRYVVEPGDLLIGMDGDFNCARWRGPRGLLNQRVCKVTLRDDVYDPRFLDYVLPGYLKAVNDATSSVTVKHLSSRSIEQIPLPFPPRHEQETIVAEIEKQFSRLDESVADLKRVRANLEHYKAAVLKSAVEGRLVPSEAAIAGREGREFESGNVLLSRLLQTRPTQLRGRGPRTKTIDADEGSASLPEGWTFARVDQLNPGSRPCAYGVLQPGDDVVGGVPFVRVGDIADGAVRSQGLKRILPDIAAAYPRTKLRGGEVLITLVGAIGRTAVVPKTLSGANVARAVGVIPVSSEVNAHWVEIWFRNPAKTAQMERLSHEVARKTLNLEDVRSAKVAIPPLAEQQRIVNEVDRRFSVIRETEAQVDVNLKRAEALRQSILHRAFAHA
jgi:type I restriction enzyme S subunit